VELKSNKSRKQLISRQLCSSLETVDKKMFPDYKTSWHCEDKVDKRYLLESVNAPLVPEQNFMMAGFINQLNEIQ